MSKKQQSKVVWADDKCVYVIRKGKTSNVKISDGKPLVQTYTFSREQYELATTSSGFGMKVFFDLDSACCLDCPFSRNTGNGMCYTHKFNQYVGFLSMLRSIDPGDLTPLDDNKYADCLDMAEDTYVRFGTYGEPSLIPIDLVMGMVSLSSNHTGYTHQWDKDWAKPYQAYFMASVEDAQGAHRARMARGYRSFIVSDDLSENGISCPASNEAGFKSNCAKCGLCSGMLGKGKKDVKILIH